MLTRKCQQMVNAQHNTVPTTCDANGAQNRQAGSAEER